MNILKAVKSNHGNKIELFDFNLSITGKTILIIGVFHGDEPEGEFLINKFMEEIPHNPKNRLLIIPCLNPDGKILKTRQNANNIDLNRNFPTKNWVKTNDKDYFGGNEAGSEIETRFIIEILNNINIDCILTLHAPYRIVNFDGPCREIAKRLSEITGYPVQEDIGYPTPGSFGTYAGIERNIPVITLELPDNESNENLWLQNKGVFEYLADEIYT